MGARNPYAKADARTLAAKKAGYPARSIFKLEEIDQRVRLLKPGMKVVDLGAAPGSWSMYASGRLGPRGHILAIDLSPLRVAVGSNATIALGDAFEMGSDLYLRHGPFDVVLSDMAPATTGSRDADQWKSFELCMKAIEVAIAHGNVGSHFVGKIFMSDHFQKARDTLRTGWTEVKTIRPEGTRSNSSEVFLIAMKKKTGPTMGEGTDAGSPPPGPGGA